MLTLSPGSACDVCAEEYGPQCMPHSIPCGHVLCASCCTTIVEKTSSRLPPSCPFCRESFTPDSVRLIRMDFNTSGWSTPRRYPQFESGSDFTGDLLAKRTEQLLRHDSDARPRSETRRLEDKVARIAAKKCSVEEVSALHKELEGWLRSERDDRTSSLFLSAALLRAILMNHLAHSEASKIAKTNEANLKNKINDLELMNNKFDADMKRQRTLYQQKSQECQQLRTEVSQLRALATSLGASVPPSSSASSSSASSSSTSPSEPTSPTSTRATSPISYAPPTPSPLSSRYNTLHSRSISMSSSSARPTTPATPSPLTRAQTPAPSMLSHSASIRSATPSVRSMTPAVGMGRAYTPAPVLSRSMTPGPASHYHYSSSHYSSASAAARSQTPVPTSSHSHTYNAAAPPPPIPPKPRRLSQPSPPGMMVRSTSEEKAEARERWIPPPDARVLVETAEGGSYYKKLGGSTTRPIGVSTRT